MGDRQRLQSFFIKFGEVIQLGEKGSLLLRASRAFDMPADVLAGQPRLQLIGTGELRMEGHKGILSYGTEEIHISGGKLVVQVKGNGLELRAMNPTDLLITGEIRVVELV